MRVTMAMLFDALSQMHDCARGEAFKAEKVVSGVFSSAAAGLADAAQDACHVVSASELTRDLPVDAASIVCCGAGFGSCAIEVRDACDVSALRLEVSSAVERYRAWGAGLLEMSMHGESLSEMVDASHSVFGNPVTIIDNNYRVLGYTKDDVMHDSLWVSVSAAETQGRDLAEIDEEGFARFLAQIERSGAISSFVTEHGVPITSSKAVNDDGRLVIVNIVHKNRDVTEGDRQCLGYFARLVGAKIRAIDKAVSDVPGSYQALLRDVASGKLTSAEGMAARLAEHRIEVQPKFTVVVVTSRVGSLKYYQLCRVEDDLKRIVAQGRSVIHERTLVLFANDAGPLPNGTLAELEAYMARNDLFAGVSDCREAEYPLYELVCQARIALDVGKRLAAGSSLVHYASVRRCYLFTLVSGRDDWRWFLHPALAMLGAHDESARLLLLPTLECLARNHGARQATADELGIQRNTLQYRIARIEQLCDIDLADAETFDHIEASFALRDFCLCMQDPTREPRFIDLSDRR